jgi:hypothetical protein
VPRYRSHAATRMHILGHAGAKPGTEPGTATGRASSRLIKDGFMLVRGPCGQLLSFRVNFGLSPLLEMKS